MSLKGFLETQTLFSLTPEATVNDAVRMMNNSDIGSILIMQDQHLVGIFTERDLLKKVVAKGLDLQSTPLAQVMTKDPTSVNSEVKVEDAYEIMKKESFRHLPIIDKGEVLGIISIRNVMDMMLQQLRYERDLLRQYLQS